MIRKNWDVQDMLKHLITGAAISLVLFVYGFIVVMVFQQISILLATMLIIGPLLGFLAYLFDFPTLWYRFLKRLQED